MSAAIVKIKLRVGNKEFEGEGTKADIIDLLEKFWVVHEDGPRDSAEEEEDAQQNDKKKASKPKTARTRATRASTKSSDNDGFDAPSLANDIKGLDEFPLISKKIVHAKAVLFQKGALILRYGNDPLTSGQIKKVLDVLGVKVSLGNLSRALAQNMSSLMTDAARSDGKPKYKLTARAIADFDEWLKKKDG